MTKVITKNVKPKFTRNEPDICKLATMCSCRTPRAQVYNIYSTKTKKSAKNKHFCIGWRHTPTCETWNDMSTKRVVFHHMGHLIRRLAQSFSHISLQRRIRFDVMQPGNSKPIIDKDKAWQERQRRGWRRDVAAHSATADDSSGFTRPSKGRWVSGPAYCCSFMTLALTDIKNISRDKPATDTIARDWETENCVA